jgi:hypothetical protein
MGKNNALAIERLRHAPTANENQRTYIVGTATDIPERDAIETEGDE